MISMMMTTYSKAVLCAGCKAFLWVQIASLDEAFLLLGGMRVTSISGTCAVCGEEYHWRAEEVRLERLMKRGGIEYNPIIKKP